MRTFVILLTATFAAAHQARAQPERTATLDLRAVPLSSALTRLQDASGLHLAFAADLVRDAEPVTLSAKDEPVDSVLLRILRPRGLECIYTGETMAAIVRADSDVGMAKMAGRAVRIIAGLEGKLEKAVQVGDEVRVPEWEDGDDRALAEGILDVCASLYFFGNDRAKGDAPVDLARLLTAYDGDVRAGAFAPAGTGILPGSSHPRLTAPGGPAALEPAIRRLLGDPDPVVRGSGIMVVSGLNVASPGDWEPLLREAVAAGAKDPAPGVRFAAALAANVAARPGKTGGFDDLLIALRPDSCAAVRGAAWARWPSHPWQQADAEKAAQEFIKAFDAEKNPILRSVGALVANGLCADDAGEARLLKALQSKDELDRMAALSVYALGRPGAGKDAAPSPNADALEKALLAAWRSPRYAESMLAAAALPRFSSFARAIAAFQDEVRRNPRSARARGMLEGFRKMPRAGNELQE